MTRNLVVGQVQSIDFLKAWVMLLKKCVESENPLCFGDIDEPKSLRGEICSRAILSSNAIRQILNGAEFLGKSSLILLLARHILRSTSRSTLWNSLMPSGNCQMGMLRSLCTITLIVSGIIQQLEEHSIKSLH